MSGVHGKSPLPAMISNSVLSGGIYIMQVERSNDALQSLKSNSCPSALHNSGERFDPPKCHLNTRVAVLKKLMEWIKFTFSVEGNRLQKLDYDASYIRISKSGIWAQRSVAFAQEKAIFRFHSGWSNFASWVNDLLPAKPNLTNRQSQRLFLEHFARRLLIAHKKSKNFECIAHPDSFLFSSAIQEAIGIDGGRIPDALHHGCQECTHKKRYRADLLEEGANINVNNPGVAGVPNAELNVQVNEDNVNPLPPNLGMPTLPVEQHDPNSPCGYVRMAVMDGKTIGHRICALTTCTRPLLNYRNGRFCADHLDLLNICGIIPCGQPVSAAGALTCNNPEHQGWYQSYAKRFMRLSFPGVRRVMRRQQALREQAQAPPNAPILQIEQGLPSLGQTPGTDVVHTFRASKLYCLETVQWACGVPIGWGKCYRSESEPQVLAIVKKIWDGHDALRPSFIAYDDACDLLRHIVTQNPQDPWLKSTKFVVDAWHYIGHQATDVLCRIWCNPAPTNGSQPDLILTHVDNDGVTRTSRAFNTETAEQLNAWLTGYEAQLTQMSNVNYDIFVHSLMLLYKEDVERRIQRRGLELSDDFWDE